MAIVKPNYNESPGSTLNCCAMPDRVDDFAGRCDAQGTGVISNPTVTTAGTLTLTYGAGSVAVDGTVYSWSGSTINVVTNATLLDRRDVLIYRVGTGITILEGTPGTYTPTGAVFSASTSSGQCPLKPDITESTDCVLREIIMPYNATTVGSSPSTTVGFIVDKSNVIGADVLGGVLQGSTNVESIIRANTLDQFTPAAASVNFNSQRAINMGLPQATTDAAQALGSLLAATYYEPTSASVSRSATSKTPVLLDTNTFTVTTPYVTLTPTSSVTIACTASTSGAGPGTLLLTQGGTNYLIGYATATGSTFTGCYLAAGNSVTSLTLTGSPTLAIANFTVMFTAISAAVEVELTAWAAILAAGSGGGQYYWGLSTGPAGSSFSQQGYWAMITENNTTTTNYGGVTTAKIRVTGLTPGTQYVFTWAHGVYWTTSLSGTLAVSANTVTPLAASTYYGPAIMRVYAA